MAWSQGLCPFAEYLHVTVVDEQPVASLSSDFAHDTELQQVLDAEERPDSNVDFLVDFPRGYDLFGQRLPLTEKLSELLHRPVEVIPEHELNQHIRDQVLKEAVEL